jgi:hypothetical protein
LANWRSPANSQDYPDIVYIMHEGMPWSMTDYAQESGHGGRGGEQVDSNPGPQLHDGIHGVRVSI